MSLRRAGTSLQSFVPADSACQMLQPAIRSVGEVVRRADHSGASSQLSDDFYGRRQEQRRSPRQSWVSATTSTI